MKTVRDIYVDALAFKRQGLSPHDIKERLLDIGNGNGYSVKEIGAVGGGQPSTYDLIFVPGDEVISFDGTDWHHRRP